MAATLWFALVPPAMGGLGGHGYHGVAFMLLGLLTPAAFPRVHLLLILSFLIALGGGIELAQAYMDAERAGEWSDFRIDAIAATIGIVYARIWRYLLARIHAQENFADDAWDGEAVASQEHTPEAASRD